MNTKKGGNVQKGRQSKECLHPVMLINFGNQYMRRAPGYVLIGRLYMNPYCF